MVHCVQPLGRPSTAEPIILCQTPLRVWKLSSGQVFFSEGRVLADQPAIPHDFSAALLPYPRNGNLGSAYSVPGGKVKVEFPEDSLSQVQLGKGHSPSGMLC